MARLWTCGFELQDMSSPPKEWGVQSGSPTVGTPAIATLVHRNGLASLRCNPAGTAQYIENQLTSGGVATRTLHRFYIRVAALPDVACSVYGIGVSDFSPGQVRLLPDGSLRLYDANIGSYIGTDTGTSLGKVLALNTWYRVELDYVDNTSSTLTCDFIGYLDGENFSGTAVCTATGGFSRVRVGALTAGVNADIYIDDIAVNDTTGTVQNDLPGPGSVVYLRPNAAGDSNDFATAVGGVAGAENNFSRVSEVTPDDATSYNETSAAGVATIDDFNVESPTSAGIPTGAVITLVQVGGRVGSNAATAASIVYRIKSQAAGTVLESASVSTAVNGWVTHRATYPRNYQLTSYTDPQAGGVWTKPLLETMQVGYRSDVDQATVRRVSALWVLVEYVPNIYTEQLKDDFSSGEINIGRWQNSFGNFSVENGRAKLACNLDYNGVSSAKVYTLQESHVRAKMFPPDGPPEDESVYLQMLVKSEVEGTDLAVEIDTAQNYIGFLSRTAYWDETGMYLPWEPNLYSWVRIRETGGQTYWDTSVDGVEWINRRVIASPAFVADANLEVQFIAHRNLGTETFAHFDNVNITNASVVRVWDGADWVSRSVKVWDGVEWITRPVHLWNGTVWKVG